MALNQTVCVVAGVIERDGLVLICQRKPEGRHPLKWEFPGGKLEPGEIPAAALARELREELGIEATIGAELARYPFSYGDGPTLQLIFYRVTEFNGELLNLDFTRILWEQRERLSQYDFLEGDVAFVRSLAAAP
jgi:8-oxo-dGTP diphosphatase